MSSPLVPALRIRSLNQAAINPDGKFVLVWMIAFRRTGWNFTLQRAVELARELKKPILVLEALRCSYPWASDRLHRFVIEGMAENAKQLADFAERGVTYYPYVEAQAGAGSGLLETLAKDAAAVVTDDFPCFFLPQMVRAATRVVDVQFEAIDSNGILPLRATDKVFTAAYHFRRWLQKNLKPFLADDQFPIANPFARLQLPQLKLAKAWTDRWPVADLAALRAPDGLAELPIDHTVGPALLNGGSHAAGLTLQSFLKSKLARYHEDRSQPEEDVASGLSPYLHFGAISVHEVARRVLDSEEWSLTDLANTSDGKAERWWGVSPAAESFLDELITWREIGFNFCWHRRDYDQYKSLPEWCRETLEQHTKDKRDFLYTLEEFEAAQTHDPLWNAAQRQLVREGRMHNYLRMLWGKKVLEWSERPQDALATLIHLNNKYAVDGRNPNSYSGIFWCFGRYDRPWAPQRPVFGTIRFMSSDNTARKFRVKNYLKKYGPEENRGKGQKSLF